MKPALTITVDKIAEVARSIDMLATKRVMVGIPSTKAGRTEDAEVNNAQLGYIHDTGAPEAGIPARPFLETGIKPVQQQIETGLKAGAEAAFTGNEESVDAAFTRVGLIAQAAVRKKITDGPFVPLKPATLLARMRRGRTGIKPLIDTAQLRNSINFVIRKVTRRR